MDDRIKAFSDNAAFYRQSTEFTSLFAKHALTLLPAALTKDDVVHDNASGPGVVSFAIADTFSDDPESMPRIHATDLAQGMVDMLKTSVAERSLEAKITPSLVDARELSGFDDGMFTHSFTNFAIMMEDADAIKAASEIHRTLRPDGTAVVTTWQRSASELMDTVSSIIRPTASPFQPIHPSWSTKSKLVDTLVSAGFRQEEIEISVREENWDFGTEEARLAYFCHPFWGMWRKGWTGEEEGRWEEVMRGELVRYAGEGGGVKGIAWIAVARK